MKIVCAQSVLYGQEAFGTLGEVTVLPDRDISVIHVEHADALIVRSKTKVDSSLLKHSRVKFVGTATAGFDHFDLDFLNQAGIAWSASTGCNANSVAEYVIAALLYLAHTYAFDLRDKCMAIVGVGEVGRRVAAKARALGMTLLLNDPPRALTEPRGEWLQLEAVLPRADIVTFHVPLNRHKRFPTWHMADCRFFAQMQPGAIFINASRGQVVQENDLMHAASRHLFEHLVLDVWCDEPYASQSLLATTDIATPHIAGYSSDGKLRGTEMVYRECCHFFEQEPTWDSQALRPPSQCPEITLDARVLSTQEAIFECVRAVFDIKAESERFLSGLSDDPKANVTWFEQFRRDYPVRREFDGTTVRLKNADIQLADMLCKLGFNLKAP